MTEPCCASEVTPSSVSRVYEWAKQWTGKNALVATPGKPSSFLDAVGEAVATSVGRRSSARGEVVASEWREDLEDQVLLTVVDKLSAAWGDPSLGVAKLLDPAPAPSVTSNCWSVMPLNSEAATPVAKLVESDCWSVQLHRQMYGHKGNNHQAILFGYHTAIYRKVQIAIHSKVQLAILEFKVVK